MHRDDVGAIHFHWGIPGRGETLKDGYGLSHIIAKHGIETIEGVIEAIARGTAKKTQITSRIIIEHKDHNVFVELVTGKKGQEPVWIVTGYKPGSGSIRHFNLRLLDGPLFFRGTKTRKGRGALR